MKNQTTTQNTPQILSLFGFKYIRFLTDNISEEEIASLKSKYWYIFIYSYKKLNLPDFHLKTQTTSVIDLRQTPEKIFAGFRKNTRNEIRKTYCLPGLSFGLPDLNALASYQLYKKVKISDGVPVDIRKEFTNCLFFNAYLNKEMVVSMSCYDNGIILRLKHIVSLRKEREYNPRFIGYASRRLIWEICKYAKQQNRESFDLAGLNLQDSTKRGIALFKQSFGGTITTIFIYRYQKKIFTVWKWLLLLAKKNIN